MKKKILFLIESFIAGGAERVLLSLANAIDKTKYDVTVASIFKKSVYDGYDAKFDEEFSQDVNRRYLIDNTAKWKYLLFNYLYNRLPKKWFYRFLIGYGYDTEIAFYEGLPTVFLSNSTNKKSKKIAWLHYGNGFADSEGKKRKQYQKVYSGYDVIVGVSKGVCDNFIQRVGLKKNVVLRYNIFDDEKIRGRAGDAIKKANVPISFVAVGRLCKVKGYDRLLWVCLRLHNEGYDFDLSIVGGGECDELCKMVKDNSMSDYVHILGHKDNPYPYIKASDWLVSSSYAEGYSTVIAESMIIGTPVISTMCCGTKELLGESEWGICCENSEDGLYNAMKSVLSDKDRHDFYRKKAEERGERFKKQVLLERIESLF